MIKNKNKIKYAYQKKQKLLRNKNTIPVKQNQFVLWNKILIFVLM